MDSARIPLFKAPTGGKPKQPQFSPPATNVTSNGLFSAQTTPQSDRHQDSPSSNSLFAGATPAAKMSSKRGGSSLFGTNGGKTSFGFNTAGDPNDQSSLFSPSAFSSPPKVTRPNAALGRYSSPPSADGEESYNDGGSPKIFEDDSRGDPTPQEDEDDTGMFGDEEDFTEDDSMGSPERGDALPHYREEIGPPVKEPGSLILRTEQLMEDLSNFISPPSYEDEDFDFEDDMDMDRRIPPSLEEQQERLTKVSKAFLQLLQENLPKSRKSKTDNDLHHAYYIASLVLPLSHSTASVTEVLRKWLFVHHPNPTPSQLTSLRGAHPNSAFAVNFWDVVIRLILRGELQEAIEVLRSANWDLRSQDAPPASKPAFGAQKVINDERYTRSEIASIKQAVSALTNLLMRCPGRGRSSYQPPLHFFPAVNAAVDSPGSPKDWRIWRLEVETALEDVKGFAEDSEANNENPYYGGFQSRARIPTEIRKPLLRIYEMMRGSVEDGGTQEAIFSESDIWQEAVVGLMMWARDVNCAEALEEDQFEESFDVDDLSTAQYYQVLFHRKRLQLAQLASVIDTAIAPRQMVNPTEQLELAAGGAMAQDPSFIDELARYSLLVGATVVEIGGWGGWIRRETTPKGPAEGGDMGFLDEDDFALLETGADDFDFHAKGAEDILRRYASGLIGTPWVDEGAEIEGWEIGVGVLNRIKNGKQLAGTLLMQLSLSSTPGVEKLLKHTAEQRLPEASSAIAYKWAKHLQSNTQNYGDILHFLALSAPHNEDARKKLHEITTFLLERSLLSSSPFPTQKDLDPRLQHILSSPSECASEILRFEISGYAALRTFYGLRETAPETAVKALTAVIRAAGEPIDGGVWDKEWESPVEPTVLPAVLRELLTCIDALGVTEALDVCKVLTDWEACGENLRKASVEVGPEGSWVDLGKEGDVVRRVRERLCKVIARGWLSGGE